MKPAGEFRQVLFVHFYPVRKRGMYEGDDLKQNL